jgi:acyl carrier protein
MLIDHGGLAVDVTELSDNTDLYSVGLTSHATVNVMLGLEEALDVEFPDEFLRRSTFSTVANICSVLATIQAG